MQPFGRNLTNNVRRKMAVVLRNGIKELFCFWLAKGRRIRS